MHRELQETQEKYKKARRLALGSTIIATLLLVLSGVCFIIDFKKKNHNLNENFTYLDPARNLMRDEDVIVNVQPLRDVLRKIEADNSGYDISIYFEYLPTGANIDINKDNKVWPVSLAKLPMAMIAMKKVERGDWTMETKLQFTSADFDDKSGTLYQQAGPDVFFTVKYLIERLLEDSDNTAYRILKRSSTTSEHAEIVEEIGLGELFTDNGKVSAKEYSRILRALYTSSYLNREHSEEVLKLLIQNNFKDFVSVGLSGTPFAHKHGENVQYNVYADSGIVYLENRPFIISVMVSGRETSHEIAKAKAKDIMKQVGEEALSYIKAQ